MLFKLFSSLFRMGILMPTYFCFAELATNWSTVKKLHKLNHFDNYMSYLLEPVFFILSLLCYPSHVTLFLPPWLQFFPFFWNAFQSPVHLSNSLSSFKTQFKSWLYSNAIISATQKSYSIWYLNHTIGFNFFFTSPCSSFALKVLLD